MTTSLYDVQTKYLPIKPTGIYRLAIASHAYIFHLRSDLLWPRLFSIYRRRNVLFYSEIGHRISWSRFPQQIDNLRLTYRLRDKLLRRENCSILIVKHILAFHYFTETHRSTFATSFWESITL